MQQNPQTKEKDKKVRVFALAKELNLESKVLLDYCKELGFAGITNQLNGLEPDQAEALKVRVKKGPKPGATAAPAPAGPAKPVIPPAAKLDSTIKTLPKTVAKPAPAPAPAPPVPTPAAQPPMPATLAPPAPAVSPSAPKPTPAPEPVNVPAAEIPVPEPVPTPAAATPAPPVEPAPAPEVVAEAKPAAPPAPPQNIIPNISAGGVRPLSGVRNLNTARPAAAPGAPPRPTPPAPTPATPAATTAPAAPKPAATATPATPPPASTAPQAPPQPATGAPTAPPAAAGPTPPRPAPAAPAAGPATTPPPRPTGPTPPAPGSTPAGPAGNVPPRSATSGGVIPPAAGNQPRPNFLSRAPVVPPPRTPAAPPRHGPGSPSAGGPGGPPRTGSPTGPRPGGPGGAPAPTAGPGGPRPGGPAGGPGGPPRAGGPARPGQSMKLTPEMIERLRRASAQGQKLSIDQISRPQPGGPAGPGGPPRPGGPAPAGPGGPARTFGPAPTGTAAGGDDDDDKKKGPGGVIGRDSRHRGRQGAGRGRGPGAGQPAVIIGAGGQVETIEQQWGSRRGPRAALLRKHMRGKLQKTVIEGRVEIAPPINVRALSEAIGMKAGELSKRLLKETGQLYGVNSAIDFNVAALIAAEKNVELVLKQQETAETKLLREFEEMMTNVDPDKLRPRPPIVTIMGHVDHGKTSLLDKIRTTKVVDTEIGGITQVIRAWSVMHKIEDPETGEKVIEKPITFLDTPGHEAFTKMRARGANVTDIAVIVVAATDGVMPQTEEAIAHARAAEVRIIVAINKVDMPNANVDRTRRQLYGLNLLPDDMGGDTQFVETSAHTGQGIDDLLTAILLEAELNIADELQADPDRPATGTCLEAYMSADEGVMATVLVQQGTLKRGDIVLCGSTFGRVRAMYSDMGRAVKEAGPSTPVRITGLNEVPNADDPFYVVDDLAKAQEIAEVRRQKEREALLNKFAPVSLESLTAARTKTKITELKVILKAEARGSVEAIRKELEKLVHEEVRTRVLHAGIGAITESDVQLALTSPEDTLVVGFNVTADDAALRLAAEWGINIREYQIIYNLVDDVKAALEGRLKPVEEVVHLGRAVVRATFKHGKVGTIAGCYVTSGVIERTARVRLIREGVVAYPQGDKVVGLDSLKRFKDDAKEVREGFECGMKITGYDDIKVGDVIEAFKIEIKQRTL